MSNLIYNGNFSAPIIAANNTVYSYSLTAQQLIDFYWVPNTTGQLYVSLQNGNSVFTYPDPALISQSQFCSIQYTSNISQSFTVTQTGQYKLSFYYGKRGGGYNLNLLQIYVNDVLIDTLVTTTSSTWLSYNKNFFITTLGTNIIRFQGQDSANDSAIAFTNINLSLFGNAPVLSSFNALRSTILYGYLTVNDLVQSGVTTPGIITTPQINVSKTIEYTYTTTLPIFDPNSLGYIYFYTNTTTTVAINSYTNSSAYSLPIGVYIIQAYVFFNPGSSAIYTIKLGLNTSASAFTTAYNYTVQNVLVASLLPTTLNYSYILTVTATTSYYFVFNTNLAGSINGTLNGKIIRIA